MLVVVGLSLGATTILRGEKTSRSCFFLRKDVRSWMTDEINGQQPRLGGMRT